MKTRQKECLIPIFKPLGLTPLEAVNTFKKQNPSLQNEKISYAGRLDPMAEGVLLLLVGEENKKRKKYEKFHKKYEVEVLFGISTDTYDALGLVLNFSKEKINIDKKKLLTSLKSFEKSFFQEYPPYSSKTAKGKPLYFWARNGMLDKILIPTKKVTIFSIIEKEEYEISAKELFSRVYKNINLVKGDFRQEEIIKKWSEVLKKYESLNFPILKLEIECSSGTYMRSFANGLGKKLGLSSFAFSIKRIAVGNFREEKCENKIRHSF